MCVGGGTIIKSGMVDVAEKLKIIINNINFILASMAF